MKTLNFLPPFEIDQQDFSTIFNFQTFQRNQQEIEQLAIF